MKFKNWTPEGLKQWAALLPSSPLINPHNKIKIWGEIHVENWEPKDEDGDKKTDREKLIELLGSNNDIWADQKTREKLADHLIENGVAVQKRGRWKQARYTEAPLYLCSECDKPEYKQHKYCQNCGARMDGGTYDGTP